MKFCKLFPFLRNIFCGKRRVQPRAAADDFEIAYNRQRQQREAAVDRILDKISAKGTGSLTKKEREILNRR
ncbi:MAG: hypothetical protein LBB79_03640 [Prevotellaceae bacterium]|jgi:hypothetical protein|nr:hypothetical protein [Prevotellaceae bacterium]